MLSRFLTYGIAIRVFGVGFTIVLIGGFGINKGLGMVGPGVVVTFGGGAICGIGMLIGVLAMCQYLARKWQ